MKNYIVFYISTVLIIGVALWFVLVQGKYLEMAGVHSPLLIEDLSVSDRPHFFSDLRDNLHHPLSILIIQIFCIMITARILGYLLTKIGQPSVIGEIIAGIALGPSLVGSVFPEFSAFLFPPHSLMKLELLSQIGVIMFMFMVGMELDIGVLKKKVPSAVIISHVSIVFPYFLGVVLAYFLYPLYTPENISFTAFALFMGITMSITAFPILARILQERGLSHTSLGTIVITCAATDDITAWCLLALVVSIINAQGMMGAMGSIVLSLVYILFMWCLVRPILHRLAVKYDTPESVSKSIVTVIFGALFLSCYLTQMIGIHALFGAFLAGVIMPSQKEFKRILSEKIEDVSLVLLLPLFFVFTGLRTNIGLLNQAQSWGICILIIGVAILGKFVGSAVAAKFVGQNWKDSLLIGVFMNTRGLMELVVLNIGYDLGILSTEIFTMLVLMTLVTTLMAGPAIDAIEFFFKPERKGKAMKDELDVLLSFGSPQSGSRLLELAYSLKLMNKKDSSITAVHFSPSADISIMEAEQHEKEAFIPIDHTAERLGIRLKKIFRVTDHVEKEMIGMVKEKSYDIILVGSSRELFTDDKTGGKVRTLIQQTDSTVGVFIDKGFKKIDHVVIVLDNAQDIFLLKYAKNLLKYDAAKNVVILDLGGMGQTKDHFNRLIETDGKGNFSLVGKLAAEQKDFYKRFDIVMTSLYFWDSLAAKQHIWLDQVPSVLIVNQ